jgi:hypothetical protein
MAPTAKTIQRLEADATSTTTAPRRKMGGLVLQRKMRGYRSKEEQIMKHDYWKNRMQKLTGSINKSNLESADISNYGRYSTPTPPWPDSRREHGPFQIRREKNRRTIGAQQQKYHQRKKMQLILLFNSQRCSILKSQLTS